MLLALLFIQAMTIKYSPLLINKGTRTTFKRIGVTEEQLDAYDLRHLTNPDPKIISKFKNPKNRFVKPFIEHLAPRFKLNWKR
jgi:hypothetical protein